MKAYEVEIKKLEAQIEDIKLVAEACKAYAAEHPRHWEYDFYSAMALYRNIASDLDPASKYAALMEQMRG